MYVYIEVVNRPIDRMCEHEKKITEGKKNVFCCSALRKETVQRNEGKERATGRNGCVYISVEIYTRVDENVCILHFLDEFPFLNFYIH
jgi:hypothetical protein